MRIIENECTVFNTKKRCPFRMVVETIDIKDLKYISTQKMSSSSFLVDFGIDDNMDVDDNYFEIKKKSSIYDNNPII